MFTTLGQSGPGRNDNEGLLHIPQSSSITGASPSDCLVLYPGGVLLLCRDAVGVFYSPSQLGPSHPTEDINKQYVSKKKEEDMPALKIMHIHQYENSKTI